MTTDNHSPQGVLDGVRVLQVTDEKGDYTGKLLAGLGADVIMVEPPGGSASRRIGPFYHDEAGPENSLFHWHYNVGKRSVVLDLTTAEGQQHFRTLADRADVLVESMPPGYLSGLGLAYDDLRKTNPRLIMTAISPFGQTGPWRDLKASDLIHLALGGEMNYTRYAQRIDGEFDTPPIAGQMWQAYHFSGDYAVNATLGALISRVTSNEGQYIDVSIHNVCSISTEIDMPTYIYNHEPLNRFGNRFALAKDGRYVLASPPSGGSFGPGFEAGVRLLEKYNVPADLADPKYEDAAYRAQPQVQAHIEDVIGRFVRGLPMEEAWLAGQEFGLLWAAIRKPEDNLTDPHWNARSTFGEVEHPEVGEKLTYPVSRWHSPQAPWQVGLRAPRIGEHTDALLREVAREALVPRNPALAPAYRNLTNRKFALAGVRVLDLTQLLATAGGIKILSSFGAECIRVEWKNRRDLRMMTMVPQTDGGPPSVNRGGYFNDINAGRMGISLNMTTKKGKEIFSALLDMSDVIAEGYRPGAMEKFGFGYEALRTQKPDIVYVQQPGFGKTGVYKDFGSIGPVANATSGLTDMSGLPEPYPPLGWLYSFMDFGGGYNCAMAMLAGIYYKKMTGKGIYIDSSQIEPGISYTGTAILDYQVNGRHYSRSGNRSPNVPAAPHGAYRCRGPESMGAAGGVRWIAIACFTDEEWRSLCAVMGNPAWAPDPRFASLEARYRHQDELDALVDAWTIGFDAWDLMDRLQRAGVTAGVCQTAAERVEQDPQLAHLEWLTPLPHSEIGVYPIKGFPAKMSATPAYQGGPIGRAGPCYAEDNQYVYGTLLGMSDSEIEQLAAEDVI